MSDAVNQRYTTVAIILHWSIALAIIGLIASGKWMVDAIQVKDTQFTAFQVYQIHKSMGLTVFVLSVLRLFWRLTHRAPQLPNAMPQWQKLASHGSHFAFYGLMIGMPILGWLMVSASPLNLPTLYFGWFHVPHFPFEAGIDKKATELWFKENHALFANVTIALLILHVGAALKHHIFDKDTILWRMLPLRLFKRS